jgi:hypothetical protein
MSSFLMSVETAPEKADEVIDFLDFSANPAGSSSRR